MAEHMRKATKAKESFVKNLLLFKSFLWGISPVKEGTIAGKISKGDPLRALISPQPLKSGDLTPVPLRNERGAKACIEPLKSLSASECEPHWHSGGSRSGG
jgi:hypothetical protein